MIIPASSNPSADLYIDPPALAPGNQIEFGGRYVVDGAEPRQVWFRFPASLADRLTRRADPFLLAVLLPAMASVRRLHVHGVVSPGLLPNLAEFQAAFGSFLPRPVHLVELTADQIADDRERPAGRGGITAFSGGVDSCFSVYRHTALSPLAPKRPLAAALMMHGFDIPLEDTNAFARAAARSRLLAEDAGLELLIGATNLRALGSPWIDTFATAVAASLAFFQPAAAFGLIPSFQEWNRARFDHGSNPLTDPLLSSLTFQVVHDGAGYGRIDKLRHLARWPAALAHLRVCWEGEKLDRNCGRCEKCLRTRLMLRVCGVDACPAFPEPLDLRALERVAIRSQSGLDEFDYLLDAARRAGLDEPWMTAAARAVRRSRRNLRWQHRGREWGRRLPAGLRGALSRTGRRWLWSAPLASPGRDNPLTGEPQAVAR